MLRPGLKLRNPYQDPDLSCLDKENSSIFSNQTSHRFEQRRGSFTLKSNQLIKADPRSIMASIPLITSMPVTPMHCSPHSQLTPLYQLINKMDNYLVVTNVLIEEAEAARTSSNSLIREVRKSRESLLGLIELSKQLKVQKQEGETKSIMESQRKSIDSSECLRSRVKQLQKQVSDLKQLVVRHQQTNIKLMLQMNDSQSNGMEHYKGKLQQSYKSYKYLEEKVDSYQERIHQLKNIKELVEQQNDNKTRTIECLQKKLRRDSLRSKNESKLQGESKYSLKNDSRPIEGFDISLLRGELGKLQQRPPLRNNLEKLPYTTPFQDDYLRCSMANSMHHIAQQ